MFVCGGTESKPSSSVIKGRVARTTVQAIVSLYLQGYQDHVNVQDVQDVQEREENVQEEMWTGMDMHMGVKS